MNLILLLSHSMVPEIFEKPIFMWLVRCISGDCFLFLLISCTQHSLFLFWLCNANSRRRISSSELILKCKNRTSTDHSREEREQSGPLTRLCAPYVTSLFRRSPRQQLDRWPCRQPTSCAAKPLSSIVVATGSGLRVS